VSNGSEGDLQDCLMDCCIINRFHSREKGEGKWVGRGEGSGVVGAVSDWW
jgi:hypothetical protein